jgi:uncharacterized protein (DUF169 family)
MRMSKNARVLDLLGLRKPPIAVAFGDRPPAGLERWRGGPVPAGCAFWQMAMEGAAFYTVPEDHLNCAVGSYTHRIELPPERAHELMDTVLFMVEKRYLDPSEVSGIPRLASPPAVVAYAPVDDQRFTPDVVIVAAKPSQAMLLYEAALKAGAADPLMSTLGRPGCAVLPLTAERGTAVLSFGCRGNRTFTGTPDDELYLAIPGERWTKVVDKLKETVEANAAMGEHYAAQAVRFAPPNRPGAKAPQPTRSV